MPSGARSTRSATSSTAFREGTGPDIDILVDLNFNYKTEGFRKMARAMEPFDLFWVEIDCYSPAALRTIRDSTIIPLASGECLFQRRGYQPFFERQAMDTVIIDTPWNGVAESLKIASVADTYEINVAPHNFYGHLATMMNAHFCSLVPNFRIMEIDLDRAPLVRRPGHRTLTHRERASGPAGRSGLGHRRQRGSSAGSSSSLGVHTKGLLTLPSERGCAKVTQSIFAWGDNDEAHRHKPKNRSQNRGRHRQPARSARHPALAPGQRRRAPSTSGPMTASCPMRSRSSSRTTPGSRSTSGWSTTRVRNSTSWPPRRPDLSADIVTVAGHRFRQFIDSDLLEPVDVAKLANWGKINPVFTDSEWIVINGEKWGVPILMGSEGLTYNSEKVTAEQAESWAVMFDPTFKGQTAYIVQDMMSIVLLYLGYDGNMIKYLGKPDEAAKGGRRCPQLHDRAQGHGAEVL